MNCQKNQSIVDLNALKIKGYSLLVANTIDRGKCRLVCWFNEKLGCRVPQLETVNNDVIVLHCGNVCIVGLYRPFKCYPGENQRTNFDRLMANLERCASTYNEICITGDINVNFKSIQVCPFRTQLENFMLKHNLDQLVMNNTR